ncbi:hypothetical protein JXQ70_05645 [bacterium]|nr:hypothetical protein [bacterium]
MKSKLGFLFRLAQKCVILLAYLSSRRTRLIRNLFPSQWTKAGTCFQCGACCDFPTIVRPDFFFRHPHLFNFIVKWHEFWYGFRFYQCRPEHNQIVFTCTHLTPERTCDDYAYRPQMCRDYPEITTWFVKPDFFPTCGFRPVRKTDYEIEKAVAQFKYDWQAYSKQTENNNQNNESRGPD